MTLKAGKYEGFYFEAQDEHGVPFLIAFNFERGHTARRFLPAECWDNLHAGLTAGQRLELAIRAMEKAYLDENPPD